MSQRKIFGVPATSEQNKAIEEAHRAGERRVVFDFTPEQHAAWLAEAEAAQTEFVELRESAPPFAKEIRLRRKSLGMSLRELAEASGVSKANLSRLENGYNENPTLDSLRRIGKVLGMTLEVGFRHAG